MLKSQTIQSCFQCPKLQLQPWSVQTCCFTTHRTSEAPDEHQKCLFVVQSQGTGPFYKNGFIGLLTTVHVFSVLTAFATYFGVIQRDWRISPLLFSCGKCWQDQKHRVQTRIIHCCLNVNMGDTWFNKMCFSVAIPSCLSASPRHGQPNIFQDKIQRGRRSPIAQIGLFEFSL